MQRSLRMQKELAMMSTSPPFGISCWQLDGSIEHLQAQIIGNKGTPYADGVFKLDVKIPERYPFEPPKVSFLTAIYHPNIDTAGRICLDILKMPPAGNWKPSINISTVLTSIQLLMNEPNPDDPLMTEISDEFKYNKPQFLKNAEEWTRKHASQKINQENNGPIAKVKKDEEFSDESSEESDCESENESQPFRKRTLPIESNEKLSKQIRL